jgi:hypothetical protein
MSNDQTRLLAARDTLHRFLEDNFAARYYELSQIPGAHVTGRGVPPIPLDRDAYNRCQSAKVRGLAIAALNTFGYPTEEVNQLAEATEQLFHAVFNKCRDEAFDADQKANRAWQRLRTYEQAMSAQLNAAAEAGDEPRVNLTVQLPPYAVSVYPGIGEIVLNLTPSEAELMALPPEERARRFREARERFPVEAVADDPTAYRPASEFLDDDRFPTHAAIRKALDANPWIRTRRPKGKNGKPIPNRLEIHAGHWHEFLQQPQPVDPLDNPAPIVDAVMELERSKEEARKRQDDARK